MGKGYYAGIDSGSTSTDVVILDKNREHHFQRDHANRGRGSQWCGASA